MKRIVLLMLALAMMAASLEGCFWPGHWGPGRGGGHGGGGGRGGGEGRGGGHR